MACLCEWIYFALRSFLFVMWARIYLSKSQAIAELRERNSRQLKISAVEEIFRSIQPEENLPRLASPPHLFHPGFAAEKILANL